MYGCELSETARTNPQSEFDADWDVVLYWFWWLLTCQRRIFEVTGGVRYQPGVISK
ncbi:hypothetical protein OH492_07400 [Vibrio chagasii]|nr:hypothetical protein [Vibrio chagasii]